MAQITIGKTGLRVEQNGFGALPIQRITGAGSGIGAGTAKVCFWVLRINAFTVKTAS